MNNKEIKICNRFFNKKITCLTAYSSSVAKILDGNVDLILIGDSLGTTLYGMKNTQSVTLDMMKFHGLAVTKYVKKSMTIIDMPYKTYESNYDALKNSKDLIKYTKAKLIKLEVDEKKIGIIKYLNDNKIKTIAHIGVTPQSYSNFSKIKILGRIENERQRLIKLAKKVELAGAKAILLECISEQTAKEITTQVSIPTIGIGSSKFCDGQVLVFDDLINLCVSEHKPKFVKSYLNFTKISKAAIKKFNKEVKEGKFPSKSFTY